MRTIAAATALCLLFATGASPQAEVQENPLVTAILKELGPNAKKPAGEVFRNVKLLGDITADRFLLIMDIGYRQSLGFSCDYCHV